MSSICKATFIQHARQQGLLGDDGFVSWNFLRQVLKELDPDLRGEEFECIFVDCLANGVVQQSSNPRVCVEAFFDWLSRPDPCEVVDEVICQACSITVPDRLNRRELQFALQAYGLYPEDALLESLAQGKLVSRLQFTTVRKELEQMSCPRGPRVVPHARRGISMLQLYGIERSYLQSGWLGDRCQDRNKTMSQQIDAGLVFPMLQNLYAICEFIVVPLTHPDHFELVPHDLREVVGIRRSPTHPCSYSELVNPDGVRIDVMVSHYWGHLFAQTLRSLEHFADMSAQRLGRSDAADVTVWICLFAINQHRASQEVGDTPEDGPFNAAIAKSASGVVMIVDADVHPFRRIWCLYEVQRARDLGANLQLLTEHGILTGCPPSCQRQPSLWDILQTVAEKLRTISAYEAHTTVQEDRSSILYRIANPWVRDLQTYENFKRWRLRAQYFEEFDVSVGRLLAGILLSSFLDSGEGPSAINCIGLGAECGAADLEGIEACGGDLRASIVTRFSQRCLPIHALAYFGQVDALEYLLSHCHSLDIPDASGYLPLHMAARSGHEAIVHLLLSYRAVASAPALQSGCSPLHRAAYAGHLPVVELLLKSRAHMEAYDSDEWTPLICAAVRGHMSVVNFMLQSGVRRSMVLQASLATKHQEIRECLKRRLQQQPSAEGEGEEEDEGARRMI